ncbi:MAG TPA: dienelactone hydrolase family protein [Gemmataceae bacterium]|nr:dienelactone hydrolase family protein [Gemmataceae bacterium]
MRMIDDAVVEQVIQIEADGAILQGNLAIPEKAHAVVLFAHGSGSSRHSPRNRFVAGELHHAGLATLLFDLLTEEEEEVDQVTAHLRFNIGLLAERLLFASNWLAHDPRTAHLPLGLFGASTGAAAALVAAAERPEQVRAIVSRGGRPDLAGKTLPAVQAPTLLIVGGEDDIVIGLNEKALARLGSPVKQLVIVSGASHLFEEPGKLEEVAHLAEQWFTQHLQ